MASNTVFLIVQGSFSTPLLSKPLEDALHKRSLEARTLDLPTAGDESTRMPPATTDDDAASIRAAILSVLDDPANPKNVVVAAASYGTIPGMSALKGLSKADRAAEGKSTHVAGMAFIGGGMHPLGYAIRPNLGAAVPDLYRLGVPGGYMPKPPAMLARVGFDDSVPEEIVADLSERGFTGQSSASYDGEVKYEAYMDIPSVAIIGECDKMASVESQEGKFKDAKERGGKVRKVLVEGAGHILSVSRPEVVADVMVSLAEGQEE